MIKVGSRIFFTYADAKSALKYFGSKLQPKPKVDKGGYWDTQMDAFIIPEFKYLSVLHNLHPFGVDEKGQFYWMLIDHDLELHGGYDVTAWYISIIYFLEDKYDKEHVEEKGQQN